MATCPSALAPGPSAQVKIDLLLLGDWPAGSLARTVQNLFSGTAEVTVTVSEVTKVAQVLGEGAFDMVFLKMMAAPVTKDLEAVRVIRFAKKKNTRLLFVHVVPEHFEGNGADIILTEPLTKESMNILVNYWKMYFSKPVQNDSAVRPPEPGLTVRRPSSEPRSESPADLERELNSSQSDHDESQKDCLHSNKERLRRKRIKDCCEQLRALLPCQKERKHDVASLLEETVEHVQRVRDQVSPAVLEQIADALRHNQRFIKKHPRTSPSSLPRVTGTDRGTSVLTASCSPVMEFRLLDRDCVSACPKPAAEGSHVIMDTGLPGSASENAVVRNTCKQPSAMFFSQQL